MSEYFAIFIAIASSLILAGVIELVDLANLDADLQRQLELQKNRQIELQVPNPPFSSPSDALNFNGQ